MLTTVLVSQVKMLLGFKQNLDDEIFSSMVAVQEDLERAPELPYFLRKHYSNLYTIPTVTTLDTPEDFIREDDNDQLFILDQNGKEHPLVKDLEGYLRMRWPYFEGAKIPQNYARVDKSFHFYPTPDNVYYLHGTYYGKQDALNLDPLVEENKWQSELPYLLIARAGLLLASGLRDAAAVQTFGQMNEIMSAKLHTMTTADDQAGMKPIIGGAED